MKIEYELSLVKKKLTKASKFCKNDRFIESVVQTQIDEAREIINNLLKNLKGRPKQPYSPHPMERQYT